MLRHSDMIGCPTAAPVTTTTHTSKAWDGHKNLAISIQNRGKRSLLSGEGPIHHILPFLSIRNSSRHDDNDNDDASITRWESTEGCVNDMCVLSLSTGGHCQKVSLECVVVNESGRLNRPNLKEGIGEKHFPAISF